MKSNIKCIFAITNGWRFPLKVSHFNFDFALCATFLFVWRSNGCGKGDRTSVFFAFLKHSTFVSMALKWNSLVKMETVREA